MNNDYEYLKEAISKLTERVTCLETHIKEMCEGVSTANKAVLSDDFEQYLGRNLIVVCKNKTEKARFVKLIKNLSGRVVKYINDEYIENLSVDFEFLKFSDLLPDITGLDDDDYFIFNSDVFLSKNSEMEPSFTEMIGSNEISLKLGPERDIVLPTPKLHYIIFTENIGLVPDKLHKIMEIIRV